MQDVVHPQYHPYELEIMQSLNYSNGSEEPRKSNQSTLPPPTLPSPKGNHPARLQPGFIYSRHNKSPRATKQGGMYQHGVLLMHAQILGK